MATDDDRAGDGLVKAGALVFAGGVLAIAIMFVPFVADLLTRGAAYAQAEHEYGLALNLATFLTCVGMLLAIAGLVRQARASRARARRELGR